MEREGLGKSLLTVGCQAVARDRNRDEKSNLRRLDTCLRKHITPSLSLWTMLAFFFAGDMHDFFVGLMGKRNIQPGRSVWKGLEYWPRYAEVKYLIFVLRGKVMTFLSHSEGSSAPSPQSDWIHSAAFSGSRVGRAL